MIRRSTLIVVLILAVLVALAFYLQREKQEEAAQITPTVVNEPLFTFTSQVEGMRVEHTGGGIVEIVRDPEGKWVMKIPPAKETDSGAVDSAISQLLSTRILSSLPEGPDLESAGLTAPTYRALLWLDDGSQELLSVGKETPTGSGYYVLVSNRGMFVVNKYSLDPLLKLADTPPFGATAIPQPETGLPTPPG